MSSKTEKSHDSAEDKQEEPSREERSGEVNSRKSSSDHSRGSSKGSHSSSSEGGESDEDSSDRKQSKSMHSKSVSSRKRSGGKSDDSEKDEKSEVMPEVAKSAPKKAKDKVKSKKKKSFSGSQEDSGSEKEDGSSVESQSGSDEKSESGTEEEESEDGKKGDIDDNKGDDNDGFFRRDKDDSRSFNEEGLRAKLEEIRKYCKSRENKLDHEDGDNLWRDEDFPPIAKSIGKEIVHSDTMRQQYKNNYKWLRPQSIHAQAKFCVTELNKCDLKFGNFSDAVFTSALGLLAIHANIENIFVDVEHMLDMGYVVFQFFKNGEWRYVIVDTLLPYSMERKSFLFSECGEPNEFWVPLVEKAYAKLNGSYQNIQEMDICEVLVDITGGVSEREEIDADKYKENKDNPETTSLFSRIQSYLKNKYILGCVKLNKARHPSNKENGEKGIYENLYYGMMGLWEFVQQSDEPRRIMKLRNYWGIEGNWNGEWCNNHEDWDRNPEIRKALLPDQRNKMKDDHLQFFMTLSDWTKEFNNWFICKVFTGKWQNYSIAGEWLNKTAGGRNFCINHSISEQRTNILSYRVS